MFLNLVAILLINCEWVHPISNLLPNKSEINLGIQTLRKGYNIVTLKGLETTGVFPKLTSLNIYSYQQLLLLLL